MSVYWPYIKSFLIGGAVIGGSKVVSNYFTPAIAALIGGLPTGIIASFFLVKKQAKQDFFHAYQFSSFILFLSIVVINLLLRNTNISPNLIAGLGITIWAIISYLILNVLGLTSKKKA